MSWLPNGYFPIVLMKITSLYYNTVSHTTQSFSMDLKDSVIMKLTCTVEITNVFNLLAKSELLTQIVYALTENLSLWFQTRPSGYKHFQSSTQMNKINKTHKCKNANNSY